jgi:PPOX class probable F420-dependent enzyme
MKEKPWALRLLVGSRLAHLATSTKKGKPHVVPICYVYDGKAIYSSIDEKPKRAKPKKLRRVLNIVENPRVSLVVDQYAEDWRKLRYVIVHGTADIVDHGGEHERAVSLLRKKYRQYRSMKLEERPIIKITPVRFVAWSAARE